MRESKSELTDRLRQEGRWDAFKKLREELKAGGMSASDAWNRAAQEFPPPQAADPVPATDVRAIKGKKPISIMQAAKWVFEHLDADWVTPGDAPSAGAWSLREWARSNMTARGEFYKSFAVRIVLPPQEAAREAREKKEARDGEHMERLFGRYDPSRRTQPGPESMIAQLLPDGSIA